MPERMSSAQIRLALADLPGVHRGALDELRLRVEAPSFPEALRLVGAVGGAAEGMQHHPDVDIRWRSVTFTLSTHSEGGVTELDVALARRILELAAEASATVVDPPARVEIALDVVDPEAVREFWRVGLGYVAVQDPEETDGAMRSELHHPDGAGPVLWFQAMDPPRTGRGRFHLDVHLSAAQAARRLEETLAAGGRLVTDEFAPAWWVLADVEGNELCICTP